MQTQSKVSSQGRWSRPRGWRLLYVFTVLALVAAACSAPVVEDPNGDTVTTQPTDDTVTTAPGDTTPEEPDDDRHLVIAIPDEFSTLGWDWGYQAQTGLLLNQIHEPLVDRHPVTNELIGALATDWELIDEVTWRFNIREGATYHDGSPVTAESIKYALDWTLNPDNNMAVVGLLPQIFEVTVVEDYVLELTTPEPEPTLVTQLPGLPVGSMEHHLANPGDYEVEPVGSGPYRFVEWNRGESYVLERFEDWWGTTDPNYPGEQSWETVTFIIRPEISSRINAVLAGEADFAWDLPPEECLSSLDDNCLAGPSPIVTYTRWDGPHVVLGDPRVREAIDIGIDRVTLGEELMGGAPPASQLVPPANPGYNPDLEPAPYDPDRARELIEEARAEGVPIDDTTLLLRGRIASFSNDETYIEAIGGYLDDIGLNFTFEMLETALFNPEWIEGLSSVPPDRGLMGVMRYVDDTYEAQRMFTLHFPCDSPLATVCFPELDEQIADAGLIFDPDERVAAQQELMEVMFGGNYEIQYLSPLNYLSIFHGIGDSITYEPAADLRLRVRMMSPAS